MSSGEIFRDHYSIFVVIVVALSFGFTILFIVARALAQKWCPRRGVAADRGIAFQMQHEMTQQGSEEFKEQRRRERQEWYHTYLAPYTLVLLAKHFQDTDKTGEEKKNADVESAGSDDGDETLQIRLPPRVTGGNDRWVEGSCNICLKDYEVGSNVVWATHEGCPHVFHEDCLLTWLGRGKKRCPVCRQWFVPPVKVEDLKKEMDHL